MPNSRVSIVIAGRILFRQKGGAYEGLVFKVDERHELKLKIEKKLGEETILEGIYDVSPQSKITFNTTGLMPIRPTADQERDAAYYVTNLDVLHGSPVRLRQFNPLEDGDPVTSYFKIPGAMIYIKDMVEDLSDFEYEIWKHTKKPGADGKPGPGTKEFVRTRQLAEAITADFDIPDDGSALSVRVQTKEAPNHPVTFQFPQEDDISYVITLDNVCKDLCYLEDFFLYYRLVIGDQYEIEQVPPPSQFKTSEASCNPAEGGDPGCDWLRYYLTGQC